MAKETMMVATKLGELRKCLVRHCNLRKDWRDKEFAFIMTVKQAMRERPNDAEPVIRAEL